MRPSRSLRRPPCVPQRASAWAGFALALLLVAAQTLGLWHRSEHAPSSGLASTLSHAAAPAANDHASLTAHVFGHDADKPASCRLFDQQTLADSLLAVAVVLPVFEPVREGVVRLVEGVAQSASTPYQARAPPSVS